MAARLRQGGTFSPKSLTCGHFLYKNVQKAFSFRPASPPDPPPGALPLDPAAGSAPDPRLGSRSPWSLPPLCQILDPPLTHMS